MLGGTCDDLEEDEDHLAMNIEMVGDSEDETEADTFVLWQEHSDAWNIFSRTGNQWHFSVTMVGERRQRLDFSFVEFLMNTMGSENRLQLVDQITQMEQGALKVFNQEFRRQANNAKNRRKTPRPR